MEIMAFISFTRQKVHKPKKLIKQITYHLVANKKKK